MERFNIYYRKDGRWEGRIARGKHKNGRRRYQYVFGKTKEQVQSKIKEIRSAERIQSEYKGTVSVLFSEFFQSIRHRAKESTAANYMMKAQKHILPAFGNRMAVSLTSSEIYAFIEEKQEARLSNRYISDILVLMKSMFKYAVNMYHILNPMEGVTLPKKKTPEIRLLDGNEQEKLQQYISEHQNHTTLGIALSMATGIRIGELCALQFGDIDIEKRILTVKKTMQRIQCCDENQKTKLVITEPKSETSKRSIPLPECVIGLVKQFKGTDSTYILSGTDKPIEPRTMQYRFARILKNVKLPSVHFHALRHIFASTCVKLGFDVKALSELLGHSSVEITLNRYVHSSFEQKREYMRRIQLNF